MFRSVVLGCVVSVLFVGVVYGKVLESMKATDGWGVYADKGAELKLDIVKGKKDKAIQMNYNLGEGGWVAMDNKDMLMDMSKMTEIKFILKRKGNSLHILLKENPGLLIVKMSLMLLGKSQSKH